MDTQAVVAMSFGLLALWTLMIVTMVAVWNTRGDDGGH